MSRLINIDRMRITLPALPGLDPADFAAALKTELARLDLPDAAPLNAAALTLPPLSARPHDTAQTLATRAAAALRDQLTKGTP